MPGHSKRPQRQEALIAALLVQPTVLLAAKAAGIGETTATRWMKEPDFQRRFAEAKQVAFGQVLVYLEQSMLGAVAVLRSVMLDTQARPTTRVQAAGKLLELALRAHEVYTYEARLTAVEAALKEAP